MENIISFFNSNFFTGFATIITGLVAWIVYVSQKDNSKTQAARLIISEIRIAEEKISKLKEIIDANDMIADLPLVLPSNNWKLYRNIFIRDFDQDEVKLISSFYELAETIDDFSKRKNNFFWITTEERARVTQQKLGEIFTTSETDEQVEIRRQSLVDRYDKYPISYTPQHPLNQVKKHLNSIQFITTTTLGSKLKNIAGLKNN